MVRHFPVLHFPDPVVFVRHFQVMHFQRHLHVELKNAQGRADG